MNNNEQNEPDQLNAQILRTLRKSRQENQTKFWKRFGVTQSTGSRLELGGVGIPPSVAILIKLYMEGTVSDGDLWRARRPHRRRKNAAPRKI